MNNDTSRFDGTWIFIVIALLAYILPWIMNRSLTLSLGAYDFAELLAKRQFDNSSYTTVMALRGHLLFFTLLIAIGANRPYFTISWWMRLIVCLLLVIAQLPPLTFINNLSDVNQQQQAILSLISLIGAIIGLSGFIWHYRHLGRILLATAGIITAIYGIIHAIDIIKAYGLIANLGIGVVGLVGVYILMGVRSLWHIARH